MKVLFLESRGRKSAEMSFERRRAFIVMDARSYICGQKVCELVAVTYLETGPRDLTVLIRVALLDELFASHSRSESSRAFG